MIMKRNRIYLDYAASTPVDPLAMKAMEPYFSKKFGNPGSLHSFGQEGIAAVDRGRETVARAIGAEFREIIFTGSATEANNLALRGTVLDVRRQVSSLKNPKIIISSIEHESVLETAKDLEKDGVEVVYLPVDREGRVKLGALEEALDRRTVLVSVMYVNNEIGTIEPIAEIAKVIREFRIQNLTSYPFFHTDAVQAFQFMDCAVDVLGVDLMTLSAHKIYGPKGIGALYMRQASRTKRHGEEPAARGPRPAAPIITGGGQEFGLRSGTENVPLMVGFARAIELAVLYRSEETERIRALRDYFSRGIQKIYPRAEFNSPQGTESVPNILNFYLPGRRAEEFLIQCDLDGIAISAGSACAARSSAPSYVVRAVRGSEERARSSVRFSFGRPTTRQEIDRACIIIKNILKEKT